MGYIHKLPDWPKFRWNNRRLAAPLAAARHLQGRLVGQMSIVCDIELIPPEQINTAYERSQGRREV